MERTRQEHLQWCKDRTIKYLDSGDTTKAYSSFMSDMSKHPETANHITLQLGFMPLLNGYADSVEEMRKWIEGFN